MKRRDFLIQTAGAAGAMLPVVGRAQVRPCAPPTLSVDGGSSVATSCAIASADAEADWQSRISGPGVVWYHDFRSDAEVNAFRWTNGYSGGNDPLARGNGGNLVRRITTDGITGGGCLEIYHPPGVAGRSHWWRPFAPLRAPGNGKDKDDPAASGTVTVRNWAPTDGGMQTAQFSGGWYAHSSFSGSQYDGDEFWLQMRVKRDPRRIQGGNASHNVGKFTYLTVCQLSLSDQEIVTYSGSKTFRMYGAWRIFEPLDQAPGGDGTVQPGGVSSLWQWAMNDTWDTVMYHVKPGREGVRETLIEVYGAHQGEKEFTLFWQQTFAVNSYDPGNGWQALICTTYNTGLEFNPGYFERWDQIIFSKQPIPCPQV